MTELDLRDRSTVLTKARERVFKPKYHFFYGECLILPETQIQLYENMMSILEPERTHKAFDTFSVSTRTFANKGPSSQSYGFSSSHVWIWELDSEENWALKNWCFWTVVLEKTLESPLDCKEIQPVHPKGDQSWIFIERTMLKLNSNTLATWCKELTHLKRPWCWERLKAGEGDDRGWDGWMALPTQCGDISTLFLVQWVSLKASPENKRRNQ